MLMITRRFNSDMLANRKEQDGPDAPLGKRIVYKKYLTPEGKIIYGPFVWSDKNDGEELSDEEAAEILAYLDRCKEENPPEPLSLEQMIEDSRQA